MTRYYVEEEIRRVTHQIADLYERKEEQEEIREKLREILPRIGKVSNILVEANSNGNSRVLRLVSTFFGRRRLLKGSLIDSIKEAVSGGAYYKANDSASAIAQQASQKLSEAENEIIDIKCKISAAEYYLQQLRYQLSNLEEGEADVS